MSCSLTVSCWWLTTVSRLVWDPCYVTFIWIIFSFSLLMWISWDLLPDMTVTLVLQQSQLLRYMKKIDLCDITSWEVHIDSFRCLQIVWSRLLIPVSLRIKTDLLVILQSSFFMLRTKLYLSFPIFLVSQLFPRSSQKHFCFQQHWDFYRRFLFLGQNSL